MGDGSMNLSVPRGAKSVWDKPALTTRLSTYDQERWIAAAWGSALALVGVRRGGVAGGVLAMLGGTVAARAAMGRHDMHVARNWIDRRLRHRGWRPVDIVGDASEESFPASDPPSWTAASGATPNR